MKSYRTNSFAWAKSCFASPRFAAFAAVICAALLVHSSVSVAQGVSSACSATDEELTARFVASISNAPRMHSLGIPPISRWSRREAEIGVFHDVSARAATSYLPRNMAILKAIAKLAGVFHLTVSFNNTNPDIKLVFISRSEYRHAFRNIPIGPLVSPENDTCRAYADLKSTGAPIQFLEKAHVLVNDEVSIDSLPTCLADALVQALGLIRWQPNSRELALQEARYQEARILLAALYGMSETPDVILLKKKIAEARTATCP